MGRNCSICIHASRTEIDEAITGGLSYRNIAKRFETSPAAVHRHARGCIASSVEAAKIALGTGKVEAGKTTIERLENTLRQTLGIVEQAQAGGDLRLALAGLEAVRRHLELAAKLTGELDTRSQVNVGLKIDFSSLTDQQLMRLAEGEDPRAVLG